MTYLVCGGAGYIGSHMVSLLIGKGKRVVVLDNLVTGHKLAVHTNADFIEGDIKDEILLNDIFAKYDISGVFHFAASTQVGESVEEPLKYYDNNISGTISLLKAMLNNKVHRIVFSSTAAVYGEPEMIPIQEDTNTKPTNPYGETKLAMEKMIQWLSKTSDLNYVSLRYFNASGAHANGMIGEAHCPESHLIPIVLQVALKQRSHISVYGSNYQTHDGTCVRDYIHVEDLVEAHDLAMGHLEAGGGNRTYNLGSGEGFSVKEIIEAARKITGDDIPEIMAANRSGDPATLVASSNKIKTELGWQPKRTNIDTIIEDAWRWHKNNPKGYISSER